MGQPAFTFKKTETYRYEDTVALLLIRTETDKARAVGEAVADLNHEVAVPEGFKVMGVSWTATVNLGRSTEGVANVFASVRVASEEDLDALIDEIKAIPGVLNPSKAVAGEFIKSGRGHNSLPM
jgi:DNA-binding Lrp family transcriptional regulator